MGARGGSRTEVQRPSSCLECHAICPPGAEECPECGFETTHNKPINTVDFEPPKGVEPPSCTRDRHWMLALSVACLCISAAFVFIAYMEMWEPEQKNRTIIVFVVLYVLHWLEAACRSGTRGFINNMRDPRESQDYLENLTLASPRVVWTVSNYHYETRTRTVTDSDGNTSIETYEEAVTTSVVSGEAVARRWTDESNVQVDLAAFPLTKLKLSKVLHAYKMQTRVRRVFVCVCVCTHTCACVRACVRACMHTILAS